MQAPGSAKAWVLLTASPNDAASPLSTAHRHVGWDRTALPSCVQHAAVGAAGDPTPRSLMKLMHGERLMITEVQPSCAEAGSESVAAAISAVAKAVAAVVVVVISISWGAAVVIVARRAREERFIWQFEWRG